MQQTFPFLDDAHIGDSRSTSFEDLIKEQVAMHPRVVMLALTMHCALSRGKGCWLYPVAPWRVPYLALQLGVLSESDTAQPG